MLQEPSLVLVSIQLIMLLKIVEWNHQSIVRLACYLRRAFENLGLFLWATSLNDLLRDDYFELLTWRCSLWLGHLRWKNCNSMAVGSGSNSRGTALPYFLQAGLLLGRTPHHWSVMVSIHESYYARAKSIIQTKWKKCDLVHINQFFLHNIRF